MGTFAHSQNLHFNKMSNQTNSYNHAKYGSTVTLPDGHKVRWLCNGTGQHISERFFPASDLPFKAGDKIEMGKIRYRVITFGGSYASHGLYEFVYLVPLTRGNPKPDLYALEKIIGKVTVIAAEDVTGMVPVHKAAQLWGIPEKLVRRLLRRGDLTGVRESGGWLVETEGITIEVSQ